MLTQESIEEAKPIIHGEIEKLKNFDVVLSVVGTMKAGKSTTISIISSLTKKTSGTVEIFGHNLDIHSGAVCCLSQFFSLDNIY